jgi:hypothetical protein
MELYDGFEHRALGNLRLYEFDLEPFLASGAGGIYLLLTDATPENGWRPYIQNVSVYTGENLVFGETLSPALNASQASVYAEFLTNGDSPEAPYLYDNSGSGPSNRAHRFADAGGSLTYRFDLPDDVTEAQLTVDMANNFVVSLSGPIDLESDRLIFDGLKAMNGEPDVFGLTMLHRRYPVDSTKTLETIALPAQPSGQSNVAFLLAATVNPPAAELQLNVELGANQVLRLSWPVSADGYQLESTSNLLQAWSAVDVTPSVEADQWVVTLPVEAGARFFRLNQ